VPKKNLIEPLLGLKYAFSKLEMAKRNELNRTTFGIEIQFLRLAER